MRWWRIWWGGCRKMGLEVGSKPAWNATQYAEGTSQPDRYGRQDAACLPWIWSPYCGVVAGAWLA